MAIDIIAINPAKPINNEYIVCSALPTGGYSRLLVHENFPGNLTIENIESLYSNRFDDPSYYYAGSGGGGGADGGDVGDVLGV